MLFSHADFDCANSNRQFNLKPTPAATLKSIALKNIDGLSAGWDDFFGPHFFHALVTSLLITFDLKPLAIIPRRSLKSLRNEPA
jgi:hypothetical protein